MFRALAVFAIIVFLLVTASCSLSGSKTNEPDTHPVFDIPPPSTIAAHAPSAVSATCEGSGFIDGYQSNVLAVGSSAEYFASWTTGGALAETAYAVYPFTTAGLTGLNQLNTGWGTTVPDMWVGYSNFSTDSWVWIEASGSSCSLPPSLPDFSNVDDIMYCALVVIDDGIFLLDQLSLETPDAGSLTNLFFLHHSVGHGIIDDGVRNAIHTYNTFNMTSYDFWDHGYTSDRGLSGPDGVETGTNYGDSCETTDPGDLYMLWTSGEAGWSSTRNLILDNHEVIAFKSCFPASDIWDSTELQERKDYYLAMRDFFDTRLDRLFVVVSQPPLHPDETNTDNAGRARQFAEWLKSGVYLTGHPNVVCFDLFNELAQPDDGSATANRLRTAYQPGWVDSHPNTLGNETVAPVFADFMCDSAGAYTVP